jgi:hypothetical protein
MTELPRRELRFAVGSRSGPRSTIWKCWIHGDEVYIASRMFGRDSKVSLHSSGDCQWSCTDSWVLRQSVPRNANRHMFRWKVTYPTSSQALLAFRVTIPQSELREQPPPTDKKKVFWVGNLPQSATVQFLFFITMPAASAPSTEHEPRFKHLASMQLSNQRWVVILVEVISLSADDIRAARAAVVEQILEAGHAVSPEYRIAMFANGGESNSHALLEACATDA